MHFFIGDYWDIDSYANGSAGWVFTKPERGKSRARDTAMNEVWAMEKATNPSR